MRLNRNLLRKIKYGLKHKAVILMYHRIDHVSYDPWHLAVTPSNFEEQLQVLQRKYFVLPLEELPAYINKRRIQSKAVCITFDDGYVDNYLYAKPLLEKYNAPATYFIAHGYIGSEEQYWWDALQNIIFLPDKLPAFISLQINGEVFSCQLENEGKITMEEKKKQAAWYYEETPATHRCALYLKLWERLKPLPHHQIKETLSKIKEWAGGEDFSDRNSFPMSEAQLNELTNHPVIKLGIHTKTHLSLPAHDGKVQETEIKMNQSFLEQKCNKPINVIAYPYGDYSKTTLDAVQKLKLNIGVTTVEKTITRSSSVHQLGRFQVKNWNGETFEKQLRHWMRGY